MESALLHKMPVGQFPGCVSVQCTKKSKKITYLCFTLALFVQNFPGSTSRSIPMLHLDISNAWTSLHSSTKYLLYLVSTAGCCHCFHEGEWKLHLLLLLFLWGRCGKRGWGLRAQKWFWALSPGSPNRSSHVKALLWLSGSSTVFLVSEVGHKFRKAELKALPSVGF